MDSGTAPTAQDARLALGSHAAATGAEIHRKYGPQIAWAEVLRILEDRTCVRYPCEIAFDSAPLQPGEFAYPVQKGTRPEEGFTVYLHPRCRVDLQSAAMLVLYQLVVINYGPFASADDAESFGAAALGLPRDEYYRLICQFADRLAAE
jgi:hypothetical protein